MGKGKDSKFVTQIIYRRNDDEHVVGYIASYKCIEDWLYSFKWSKDGKHWSRKWVTYNDAIRTLLEKTGHQKTDDYHIIPIPETFRNQWK